MGLKSWASQVVQLTQNLPADTGDTRDEGSIPGSGRSPGEENVNPLQHSSPGRPMDRGACRTTVHRVGHN